MLGSTPESAGNDRQLVLSWLQRQLTLLSRERNAEHEQSHLLLSNAPARLLERHGLALLNLGVASISTARVNARGSRGARGPASSSRGGQLGDKTALVELHRPSAWHVDSNLPQHSFRTGDLCAIQEHGGGDSKSKGNTKQHDGGGRTQAEDQDGHQGVIYSASQDRIVVAVSLKDKGGNGPSNLKAGSSKQSKRTAQATLQLPERCRLVKVANDSTFDRMDQTMSRLGKLLGFSEDDIFPTAVTKEGQPNTSADPAQEGSHQADPQPLPEPEAVEEAEASPPGTEVEAIAQSDQGEEPEADNDKETTEENEEDEEEEIDDQDQDEQEVEVEEASSDDDNSKGEESVEPVPDKPQPIPKLITALLGLSNPTFISSSPSSNLPTLPIDPPINANLNPSQLAAIDFALRSQPFSLLHGPPGTGKTTTLIELIAQVVLPYHPSSPSASADAGAETANKRRKRVLVCAASNLAIDNLLERLVVPTPSKDPDRDTPTVLRRAGISVVRLGHPARVMPALVERTLDRLVSPSESAGVKKTGQSSGDGAGAVEGAVDRAEAEMVRDVDLEMKRLRAKLEERETPRGPSGAGSGAGAKNKKDKKWKKQTGSKHDDASSAPATTGRLVLRGYARKKAWSDLRALRKEHESRSRKLMRNVLGRADIVLCTCHGAGSRILERAFERTGPFGGDKSRGFDMVVVDEACQALEPAVWIPILRAVEQQQQQQERERRRRLRGGGDDGQGGEEEEEEGVKLVLAGDHLQLPPTVKDPEAGRIRKAREARRLKMKKREARKAMKAMKKKQEAEAEAEKEQIGEDSENEESGGEEELEDGLEDMTLSDVEEGGASSENVDAAAATEDSTSASQLTVKPLRPPRTLETTLFSRLLGMYGPSCKAVLEEQYRMNTVLQGFPNSELYENRLRAWEGCAQSRLRDLPHYHSADVKDDTSAAAEDDEGEAHAAPLVFIDTAGLEMFESSPDGSSSSSSPNTVGPLHESKSNANEAALVLAHVKKLVSCGLKVEEIVVLAPYAAQVALIREMLGACRDAVGPVVRQQQGDESSALEREESVEGKKGKKVIGKGKRVAKKDKRAVGGGSKTSKQTSREEDEGDEAAEEGGEMSPSAKGYEPISLAGVEVGTVDGMQGREKEAVVLSLVRSNREGEVGFLAEKRRLNVAMTRAKRHLCVVGDSDTVGRGGDGYLRAWMGHLTEHALVVVPE